MFYLQGLKQYDKKLWLFKTKPLFACSANQSTYYVCYIEQKSVALNVNFGGKYLNSALDLFRSNVGPQFKIRKENQGWFKKNMKE